MKCLEKDPRRRYASAHELGVDLEHWLQSRPIAARRVSAAERAWLWCKRKPAVASLAAAVLLAAVGGTAAVAIVQTNANRLLEKKNDELQASNAKLDEQRKRAIDRETQAIDAVKKFRDAVAKEPMLRNNPSLEELRKRLLKEPLAFFRVLREQLVADRDTRPASLERLAMASVDLGQLINEIGDKQDALRADEDALPILERLARENPSVKEIDAHLAASHENIGNLQHEMGLLAKALASLEQARSIWDRLRTTTRPTPSSTTDWRRAT